MLRRWTITVEQLIERLRECDPEAVVTLEPYNSGFGDWYDPECNGVAEKRVIEKPFHRVVLS